jgi:hypothetical protein
MLADEKSCPEQIEIFRAMTGDRRLQLAEQLYWTARKRKLAGLRAASGLDGRTAHRRIASPQRHLTLSSP